MKKVLWLGCLSYLLIGFAHVVIGSLLPKLLEHFGRNYSEGGSLIFAQFIGFLAGVLVSPVLTQRLGKKSLLLSAIGLLAGAELVYTIIPLWEALYPIGFIAGFGFGTIEAIIGTIVIMAFTEKAGSAMSRLEVFFRAGSSDHAAAGRMVRRFQCVEVVLCIHCGHFFGCLCLMGKTKSRRAGRWSGPRRIVG